MSVAVCLKEYRIESGSSRKDFIDFIEACSNPTTGLELVSGLFTVVQKNDSQEVLKWFKEKGLQISIEDCSKIVLNKDHLKDFRNNLNMDGY